MLRLVIGVLILMSCIGCVGHDPSAEVEKQQTADVQFKPIGNPRFNFWLDIPVDWKPEARSDNGDGYYLVIDDSKVDLRIYGCYEQPKDDHDGYRESFNNPAYQPKPFTCQDGYQGVHFINDGCHYFVRTENGVHVVFFVEADQQWIQEHDVLLQKVAASLRFGVQTYTWYPDKDYFLINTKDKR